MSFTYRWADESQTTIRRSDNVFIPVDPSTPTHQGNPDYDALVAGGLPTIGAYQRWASLAAAQAALLGAAEAQAKALRLAVAGTDDATKLAIYREKYAVAAAALNGDAEALAKLQPEAQARGETAAELAAVVKALGDAWAAAGLAIDAAYQTHKAAIAGLDLDGCAGYDPAAGWPALG